MRINRAYRLKPETDHWSSVQMRDGGYAIIDNEKGIIIAESAFKDAADLIAFCLNFSEDSEELNEP